MTASRAAVRLLAGAALMLAIACGAGQAGASGAVKTDHVDLPRSYLFRPADISVKAGTTVTWTNNDQFTHTVRLGDGTVLGQMKPGESLTHVFGTPGVFKYDCSLHPQNMKGTVTVTAP